MSRRIALLAISLWLLFALLVGASFFERELWSDEVVSLTLAAGNNPAELAVGDYQPEQLAELYTLPSTRNPVELWNRAAVRDNHPPGYPVLLSALASLFDAETLDWRWLRVANIILVGVVALQVVSILAELGSRYFWAPLSMSVFGPMTIYAAREIRAYGLVMVLALAAAQLCLLLERRRISPIAWAVAISIVNLVGCSLHKLFLGVVVAEAAFLLALALTDRERWRTAALLMLALAVTSVAVAAALPNLVTTAPTITAFDTQWLISPRDFAGLGTAFVTYLGYYASFWLTPPDPLSSTLGTAYLVVFVPLLPLLTWVTGRELFDARRRLTVLALIGAPLAFLFLLYGLTGVDFSRAIRYSVIWVPFAAIFLMSRTRDGAVDRVFLVYSAVAICVSSALVLTNAAHLSPDRARSAVSAMPQERPERLIWVVDETLSARALLLALHSELQRADRLPGAFSLMTAQAIGNLPESPDGRLEVISGPKHYGPVVGAACAGGNWQREGAYFTCKRR